jgi:tRNA-dihydrouridine synthase B
MGAGMAVSEMLSSNPEVWRTDKSRLRMVHNDEPGIRAVQIAGCDPEDMAAAPELMWRAVRRSLTSIWGCPAKKSEPQTGRICAVAVSGFGQTNPHCRG